MFITMLSHFTELVLNFCMERWFTLSNNITAQNEKKKKKENLHRRGRNCDTTTFLSSKSSYIHRNERGSLARSLSLASEIRPAGWKRRARRSCLPAGRAFNATIPINHLESGVNVGWHFKSIARVRLKRAEEKAARRAFVP